VNIIGINHQEEKVSDVKCTNKKLKIKSTIKRSRSIKKVNTNQENKPGIETNKINQKIRHSLYNPSLNQIENLFSQFKNHIKNKSPNNYEELKKTIDYIFKNKIKDEHLKNYFNYLFTQANDFINKNS
jgi:hypothetical protein